MQLHSWSRAKRGRCAHFRGRYVTQEFIEKRPFVLQLNTKSSSPSFYLMLSTIYDYPLRIDMV